MAQTFGLTRKNLLRPAAALLLCLCLVSAAGEVAAQERQRSRSIIELFFGDQNVQRFPPRPQPPAAVRKPQGQPQAVRKPAARRVAPTAIEPAAVAVQKAADAKTVIVVGDFTGSALAEGLVAAFAESTKIRVIDRTNGSSGFVRDDHYDWPAEIAKLVETEKPSAVVAMIGANDRQQMLVGAARENKRSDAWMTEYERRAATFAGNVGKAGVKLLWVGMAPFKSGAMSADMVAFNDVFRGVAGVASGNFVDVWEGFVDDSGAFVATGPDISGQAARLRTGDGLNFTAAGKRKLAFYVEKPLAKLLGETGGALAAPLAVAPGVLGTDAGRPVLIDRTVPISLSDPELDGGAELLGADISEKTEARTALEKLAIEGVAAQPPAGRADDFSRRPKQVEPDAATAIQP